MKSKTNETPEIRKVQHDGYVVLWTGEFGDRLTGKKNTRKSLHIPYTKTAHLISIGHGTKTHYAWPNGRGEVGPNDAACYQGWKTGVSRDYGIITDPEQVTCAKCRKYLRKGGHLK